LNAWYIFFCFVVFAGAPFFPTLFSLTYAHTQHSFMNMDIDTPVTQPINKNKGKGKMIMGELDTLPW
jgi:hypothetical protein